MTKLLLIISLFLLITNARAQNQTVTDGGLTRPVIFGAGDCDYSWTNSDLSIGLSANGTGNIAAFRAINKGAVPITVTITATPSRRPKAYILGSDRAFSTIDIKARTVTGSFNLPYGNYGLAVSSDGNVLYVTGHIRNRNASEVAMFDLKTYQPLNAPLNLTTPRGLAVNRAGTVVYIATVTSNNSGRLVVVDGHTFKVITSIDIDADPYGILLSPDDNRIYVAQRTTNKVAIIDALTNTLINDIPVGAAPELMAITRDGRYLYTGNTNGNSVTVIDTQTLTTVDIPIGRTVSGLAFVPGDRYLYVVNKAETSVTLLDVQTRTVFKVIDLPGGGNPTSIAVTPDQTQAYVVNNNGVISVINTATHTLEDPFYTPTGAVSFGNFMSEGTTCPPETFTITVLPILPPQVNASGDLSSFRTTYGDVSATAPMTVDGEYLKAPVVLTAPAGLQISIDNINFSNMLTLTPDAEGKVNNARVYVRLANTISAGNFSAEITITGGGGVNAKVTVSGLIAKAPLSLTADPVAKKYGETLPNGPGATGFTVTGLKNNGSVTRVIFNYGSAAAPTAKAGNYVGAVTVSSPTGPGFNADNYTIRTPTVADATVAQIPLEIKANDLSRAVGRPNPTLTATYTGFVNNETAPQLNIQPLITTTATTTSPAGKYPITISTITADNYIVTTTPGILTIYTAAQSIIIPNTFTPNGDNINDLWTIVDLQYHPSCRVQIFDRRGGQVYNSLGYTRAWDGTKNGVPLPAGTYYYLIEFSATERSRGAVTILR